MLHSSMEEEDDDESNVNSPKGKSEETKEQYLTILWIYQPVITLWMV